MINFVNSVTETLWLSFDTFQVREKIIPDMMHSSRPWNCITVQLCTYYTLAYTVKPQSIIPGCIAFPYPSFNFCGS
jgi:hypothetical protein